MTLDENYGLTIDVDSEAEDAQLIPIMDGNDGPHSMKLKNGDVLGVLPLRNMVLFPGVLLPVTVARPKSQRLVKNAYEQEKLLAVCCQIDRDVYI